jgi:lysine-N-methylase
MVTIDHPCYQRNAELFQATGRFDEFKQAFLPLANPSSEEYAVIAKQRQGQCWFLQGDNLCRLQREAGHEHLDAVCKTFPRYPVDSARGIELTLSFSCPAVLALASSSFLNVTRSEIKPARIYSNEFVTRVYPQQYSSAHPLHYYFELEQHFIDILQSRSMSMSERIQLICDTADYLLRSGTDDIGRSVTRVIYRNYEQMGAADSNCRYDACDILVENFFVNTVLKKLLYDNGIKRGSTILLIYWRRIQQAYEQACKETKWECIRSAVSEIEFEYSHCRSRFKSRYQEIN